MYDNIFKDKLEKELLDTQRNKLFIWVRYIVDIFLTWTHGQGDSKVFWKDLNKFEIFKRVKWRKYRILDLKLKENRGYVPKQRILENTLQTWYLVYKKCYFESLVEKKIRKLNSLGTQEEKKKKGRRFLCDKISPKS